MIDDTTKPAAINQAGWMAQQNPLTRIQQVAEDLGRLGDEIEGYIAPDAKLVLLHWHQELMAAVDEIQRQAHAAMEK